jgi:hypothetical protein
MEESRDGFASTQWDVKKLSVGEAQSKVLIAKESPGILLKKSSWCFERFDILGHPTSCKHGYYADGTMMTTDETYSIQKNYTITTPSTQRGDTYQQELTAICC